MLVIPEIIDSITGLAKSMPEYYNNVKNWGLIFFKSNPEFADYFTKASKDIFDKLLDWLQNDLLQIVISFWGQLPTVLWMQPVFWLTFLSGLSFPFI